ncbi:hypothetical protein HELRODRAFT_162967 [Helobdella robusta]|uniref:Uncharacterized protein n=1 Tax=Helobdella robusta TaxID=6412 RepID=T1ETG2_HELRO|nr:hypothetical protein HELRODRAFT_162967 [Helobdella robusta]ESN99419.1 hypothetical protein HELRODRAFT_162967 [Helobdella robusta]
MTDTIRFPSVLLKAADVNPFTLEHFCDFHAAAIISGGPSLFLKSTQSSVDAVLCYAQDIGCGGCGLEKSSLAFGHYQQQLYKSLKSSYRLTHLRRISTVTQMSYLSGHFTHSKKQLLQAQTKSRCLPMAKRAETTEMRYVLKRNNAEIMSKDLVWWYIYGAEKGNARQNSQGIRKIC